MPGTLFTSNEIFVRNSFIVDANVNRVIKKL